jgi:hypothetical protein
METSVLDFVYVVRRTFKIFSYVLTSFSLRFEFKNYVPRRALCVNSLTFRQTQFVTRKRYT